MVMIVIEIIYEFLRVVRSSRKPSETTQPNHGGCNNNNDKIACTHIFAVRDGDGTMDEHAAYTWDKQSR